jgi:hypothetical protein
VFCVRLALAGLINFGLTFGKYEVAFQIKLKYGGFCPLPPCPQIAWVPLFSSEKALTLKIGGLGSKTHEKLRRLQTN